MSDGRVLEVGTEVSAKYRGAFCEARITHVKKLIKIRVSWSKPHGGSATLTEDQIKGTIKEHSVVEGKKDGVWIPATVLKITDASTYTVVFDDGDKRTLGRNSVCPQGAKHFNEEWTLDYLPLNNPENFGTPVILEAKKQRKRRKVESSDISGRAVQYSEEEEVGKVAFYDTHSKKQSLVPVLIACHSQCEEFASGPNPGEVVVRSFKTGKFMSIPREDMCRFDRLTEPLQSILNNTNGANVPRAALEKALAFYDTGVLPLSWETEPVSPVTASPPGVDDGKARAEFLAGLAEFWEGRGAPLTRQPSVGYHDLDLYTLHCHVTANGGHEIVSKEMKWRSICTQMNILDLPASGSHTVRNAYTKYLLPYIEDRQAVKKKAGSKRKNSVKTDSDGAEPVATEELMPDVHQYEIGQRVKVLYGATRHLGSYEAKINDKNIDTKTNQPIYYIHYAGWNARYDEWIAEDMIVSLVNRSNKRNSKGTLLEAPKDIKVPSHKKLIPRYKRTKKPTTAAEDRSSAEERSSVAASEASDLGDSSEGSNRCKEIKKEDEDEEERGGEMVKEEPLEVEEKPATTTTATTEPEEIKSRDLTSESRDLDQSRDLQTETLDQAATSNTVEEDVDDLPPQVPAPAAADLACNEPSSSDIKPSPLTTTTPTPPEMPNRESPLLCHEELDEEALVSSSSGCVVAALTPPAVPPVVAPSSSAGPSSVGVYTSTTSTGPASSAHPPSSSGQHSASSGQHSASSGHPPGGAYFVSLEEERAKEEEAVAILMTIPNTLAMRGSARGFSSPPRTVAAPTRYLPTDTAGHRPVVSAAGIARIPVGTPAPPPSSSSSQHHHPHYQHHHHQQQRPVIERRPPVATSHLLVVSSNEVVRYSSEGEDRKRGRKRKIQQADSTSDIGNRLQQFEFTPDPCEGCDKKSDERPKQRDKARRGTVKNSETTWYARPTAGSDRIQGGYYVPMRPPGIGSYPPGYSPRFPINLPRHNSESSEQCNEPSSSKDNGFVEPDSTVEDEKPPLAKKLALTPPPPPEDSDSSEDKTGCLEGPRSPLRSKSPLLRSSASPGGGVRSFSESSDKEQLPSSSEGDRVPAVKIFDENFGIHLFDHLDGPKKIEGMQSTMAELQKQYLFYKSQVATIERKEREKKKKKRRSSKSRNNSICKSSTGGTPGKSDPEKS